ncbi:hypothetical protein PVAR5_4929 [Paecilomyces variotii No. 5]|uniref:Uncharacterized protein n=1 Tax=Byssochlamys spectabilis (strain No. 5 / NBRC 109023) TaxID=1356009 RepID=V5FFD7_BYSSN|nr:hypothetical protein PVAR5_4929 [Paecilomyces variotii No. 5]
MLDGAYRGTPNAKKIDIRYPNDIKTDTSGDKCGGEARTYNKALLQSQAVTHVNRGDSALNGSPGRSPWGLTVEYAGDYHWQTPAPVLQSSGSLTMALPPQQAQATGAAPADDDMRHAGWAGDAMRAMAELE